MSVKVSGVASYVQEALQVVEEQEEEAQLPTRKVTVRLSNNHVGLLDYVAGKLKTSRTGLAEELLARAIIEAVAVVGLPSEEDGFELVLSESEEEALAGAGVA